MKIIKDKLIIDDSYRHIADDEKLTSGDITVSLARWKRSQAERAGYVGNIGVRLSSSDKVEDIAADLSSISLLELEFPAFTDGRAFSHARLLRSRYDYDGEIRATGSYMADQVFYLSRVGVNAFQLENPEELEVALSTIDDFSVNYQVSTN